MGEVGKKKYDVKKYFLGGHILRTVGDALRDIIQGP